MAPKSHDPVNTAEFCVLVQKNKDYKNKLVNANRLELKSAKSLGSLKKMLRRSLRTCALRTVQKHVGDRSVHMKIEGIVTMVIVTGIAGSIMQRSQRPLRLYEKQTLLSFPALLIIYAAKCNQG